MANNHAREETLVLYFLDRAVPANTALGSLRQEAFKFKASLGYVGRPCQRKTDMKMGRGRERKGEEGRRRRGESPNSSLVGGRSRVSS